MLAQEWPVVGHIQELLSTHPNPEELVSRASASTTPLNCACMVGSLPIVELLVAYGAEVFLLCFFTPHIWSFLHPFIHLTDQCPSWTKRLDTLLPSLHARLLPYCQLLSHWVRLCVFPLSQCILQFVTDILSALHLEVDLNQSISTLM